jgi:hypothetical protein
MIKRAVPNDEINQTKSVLDEKTLKYVIEHQYPAIPYDAVK